MSGMSGLDDWTDYDGPYGHISWAPQRKLMNLWQDMEGGVDLWRLEKGGRQRVMVRAHEGMMEYPSAWCFV